MQLDYENNGLCYNVCLEQVEVWLSLVVRFVRDAEPGGHIIQSRTFDTD